MIKKSLVIFIILFALCNIAAINSKPDTRYARSDVQINTIIADRYIYSKDNYKAVILGSSLAARIVTDSLTGFYNLAFSGLSVYDGGAVLLSKKVLPPTVFIEVNALQKPKSDDFTLEFESGAYSYFKSILPALRTENQPVFLVKKGLDNLKEDPKATVNTTGKKRVLKNSYLPQNMFKSLLDVQIRSYSKLDTTAMEKSIVNLKELISNIKSRGSRVVFFEMPVNPVIQRSPKAKLIREAVMKNFPNTHFTYIALPPQTFKTRDGLHMAQKEAADYTSYFKQQALAN